MTGPASASHLIGRDVDVDVLLDAVRQPGLTVVAGPPGIGKTAVAAEVARRCGGVVFAGGGLLTLRDVPALALTRAVRAPLPVDDPPLTVEAVRARVGDGLLIVDDLQWADRLTIGLLPRIARYCRLLLACRTPAPLVERWIGPIRQRAACWRDLEPLGADAAIELVAATAPHLADVTAQTVVERAVGNPLLLTLLARHPDGPPTRGLTALAALVAELPQAERTALAALGLIGRPAPASLLGPGADGLVRLDLAVVAADLVCPRDRLLADVAAGVASVGARAAMHRAIAEHVEDAEAARHLAAAGDLAAAAGRAERAATTARGVDDRAALLRLAAEAAPSAARGLAAAQAALAAGDTAAARRLAADTSGPAAPEHLVAAAVVAATAAAAGGDLADGLQRLDGVTPLLDDVSPTLRAQHLTARLRVLTGLDPDAACELGGRAAAAGESLPAEVLIAYGAALLAARRDGWDRPLWTSLEHADGVTAWTAELLLVRGMRDLMRHAEAAELADRSAADCASRGAYLWETSLRAESLWLRLLADGAIDAAVRGGAALLARELPAEARVVAVSAAALAHADGGAITAARGMVRGERNRLLRWVAVEIDWLDGDSAEARTGADALLGGRPDLAGSLAELTRAWAAPALPSSRHARGLPQPVAATLAAFDDGDFSDAAGDWDGVCVREQLRCLLAADERAPNGAVDLLLSAERLATDRGYTVLLGRIQRALRQRGIVRRPTSGREASLLSPREHEVLELVAAGHSTRRIADRLGLSPNTVETYVKSAVTKLGARTRTEAAVRASRMLS
ncbi:MAG: LuxR family transcriptional regulator [Pseudonocardiales bacterium]|nr:MAG: LuxR family transcriptional regulator [Pseudonocardiales bacterium]